MDGPLLPSGFYRSACSSKAIHVGLHFIFLLLNGLNQFDLSSRAVKVVLGTVNAEVSVSRELIGQESQSDGEGHHFSRESDEFFFLLGQYIFCGFQITSG